jgi:hypothetical protein
MTLDLEKTDRHNPAAPATRARHRYPETRLQADTAEALRELAYVLKLTQKVCDEIRQENASSQKWGK